MATLASTPADESRQMRAPAGRPHLSHFRHRKFPLTARVCAVDFIRPMAGRSQPWLLRCDDRCYYVVKFRNNPQHTRILANELLCSRLAQLIGLPVAVPAVVLVPPGLLAGSRPPELTVGGRRELCTAGLQFGSRYPGPPERTLVVDFLPDRLLSQVHNLVETFVGGFVFDKWTCNCDGRQAVFFRSVEDAGRPYTAQLIDHGCCFNGGEWSFPDSPIRSLYPRRLVYDTITSLESFEPSLSSIERLKPGHFAGCIADLPSEWCSPHAGELKPLVARLYARAKKLRQLILEARVTSRCFRNWVTT